MRHEKNIRILYLLTDSNFGGTEASLTRLAQGMKQRGYQISICSIKKPGFMAQEWIRQGLKVTSLNLPSSIRWHYPLIFLMAFFRWHRLLRQERPDIIHSFLFQANFLTALHAFQKNTNLSIIMSERCMALNKPRWRILLDRWILGRADLIIAVSEAVKQKLFERELIQKNRVQVVYHGVEERFLKNDIPDTSIRTQLGIEQKDYLIGTVARLHEEKGIRILLEAAGLALIKKYPLRVLIIGTGPEKEALMKFSEKLGITNRVIFAGFRPDVLPWLVSLDIFCLPSLEEGLPQALLEAMALGKPVVASAVGGVLEVIQDQMCGILIPPDNPEALFEAVSHLIQNPEETKRVGDSARQRIKKDYLLCDTLDRMEQIYQGCVTRKSENEER